MEPTKTTPAKSGKDKASFRDTFNQLTFFTLVGSAIVVFTPLAPGVRQFVPETLFYTLFTWSLITGLPMAWKRRAEWLPKWRSFWLSLRKGSQAVGTLIPSLALPDLAGTGGEPPQMNHSVPIMGQLPAPFHLLPVNPKANIITGMTKEQAAKMIEDGLQLSGISFEGEIEILEIESGPTLLGINFRLPDKIQASMISKKKDDIGNHLGFSSTFSIAPSVNHRSAVCFVIPKTDAERSFVYMRDVIPEFLTIAATSNGLPIILGKDMQGKPLIVDLTKFPHLLIGGATNSGKSVQINTIIESVLMLKSPEEVKVILIDPKRVELEMYNGYPHLLMPVIADVRRAALVLKKICNEMDRRYDLFAKQKVRNFLQYNKNTTEKIPFIVVIIDEYADLMIIAPDDIEDSVQRITQLARAAGIHLIIGTQRPSVNVVTGTIKANLPTRMAFAMKSPHDYRTVMDKNGPPLLGKGDGVFMLNAGTEYRFQSAAISVDDDETTQLIENVKQYWSGQSHSTKQNQIIIQEYDEGEEYEEEQRQAQMSIEPPSSKPVEDPVAVIEGQAPQTTVVLDAISFEEKVELNLSVEEPPKKHPEINPATAQVAGIDWSIQNDIVYPDNTYATALDIAKEYSGISVDILKLNMGIDFDQATTYMGMMHETGLLGEFVDGKREYVGNVANKLSDEELAEQVKRQIMTTGKVSSEALAKNFTIQKARMIAVLKQLAEDGVLNRPEVNGSSYTIAWTQEEIENYLNDRPYNEMPY